MVSVMAFVAILGYAYGASTLDTSFITETVTPMFRRYINRLIASE